MAQMALKTDLQSSQRFLDSYRVTEIFIEVVDKLFKLRREVVAPIGSLLRFFAAGNHFCCQLCNRFPSVKTGGNYSSRNARSRDNRLPETYHGVNLNRLGFGSSGMHHERKEPKQALVIDLILLEMTMARTPDPTARASKW